MKIEKIVDELMEKIMGDNYFSDIRIMKAYPCSVAPSRVGKETIALGLDRVDLASSAVDDSDRAGEISVFADIFIPLKAENSRASDIFTNLCRCLCVYNILSVSAQRITVDTNSASYVLKTVFTFNDEIEVG